MTDEQTTDEQTEERPAATLPLSLTQLGLPTSFVMNVRALPDGAFGIVIRIEHSAGATAVMIPPDVAVNLANQLSHAAAQARQGERNVKGNGGRIVTPPAPSGVVDLAALKKPREG